MDSRYEYVKSTVVNFKFDYCCWFIPVRIGAIVIGYINVITSVMLILAMAQEFVSPIIMVQSIINEDNSSPLIAILVYSTDLAFNVVLLCALYRRDLVLLRAYLKYAMVTTILFFLVYSMAMAAMSLFYSILVVMIILYQIYVIFMVRSALVEIRVANKSQMISAQKPSKFLDAEPKETSTDIADVEAAKEQESLKHTETIKEENEIEAKKKNSDKMGDKQKKGEDKKGQKENKEQGDRGQEENKIENVKKEKGDGVNSHVKSAETKQNNVKEDKEIKEEPQIKEKATNSAINDENVKK